MGLHCPVMNICGRQVPNLVNKEFGAAVPLMTVGYLRASTLKKVLR